MSQTSNIPFSHTVGGKIQEARVLKNLTQKELGLKCGFRETTAVSRISQYETNQKTPRDEQLKDICSALDIDEDAIIDAESDLLNSKFVAHVLFKLEDTCNAHPVKIDDKYYLEFGNSNDDIDLNKFLENWYNKLQSYKEDDGSISFQNLLKSFEEYPLWKLEYFKNHNQDNSESQK